MTAAYEHNGQPISSEAFYAIACDPQRPVAVEACAGAGKTWMLVSRILRALLDGVPAHEILAITFTKKAAGEMRERLNQWLYEFSTADEQTLAKQLLARGINDKNAKKPLPELILQLSKLYQTTLDQARPVQIRTFHGWFAALLRSAPIGVLQQLQLPVDYELLEDDKPAKAALWPLFYAALMRDAQSKADFEALVFDWGRSQTEKALATALDKHVEFSLADAQGVVARSVKRFDEFDTDFAGLSAPDEFFAATPQRWKIMQDAARALGQASAKSFSAAGTELEMALSAQDVNKILKVLLNLDNEPRKFSEKIVGLAHVRAAQDLALKVVAARHQHRACDFQQRMTRLTRVLLIEFAALKRARGWVDMNDVERAAFVLLSDPVLSGWVQERLDARVSQLLIDEFQDTNPLQWQALSAWLSAYAGSGGRTPCVFLVGDPKQSIYRFRRAEPQVFMAAKKFMVDALGGAVLSCDHTRRNSRQVLGAVNTVMTQAAVQDGYTGFRLHTSSSDQEGQIWRLPQISRHPPRSNTVDLLPNELPTELPWRDSLVTPRELPEDTLRTLEARQAAQWLAQHLALSQRSETTQLQPKDLMVLSRQRVGLLPLQLELRKLGIAAQIGEKTELMDCCEVQDLTALLDVLVSPQHDLSLARVLKSPLFGLGDSELVNLALQLRQAQAEQVDAAQTPSWFDLLQTKELLTHDGRGVGVTLSRWKRWLDQLPPFDALQAIYTDGDVLARFAVAAPTHNRNTVVRNLTALLEVSLQNGGGRYATPYAFVRALNAGGVKAPAAVDPHALRLLTVHGAKGLEAQTVLLLDSDSPERNTPTMTVLVDWPAHAAWPQKFVFLTSESQPPFCAQAELQAEHLERSREELNSLYVALTRARTTLVISSIEPYRNSTGSWWQRLFDLAQAHQPILPEVANTVLMDAVEPPSPELIHLKELPVIPENHKLPATNNAAPEILEEVHDGDEAVARIGLAMHRLLEWGGVSPNNTAAVIHEFLLSAEQGALASDMAQSILGGQGSWAWDTRVVSWQGVEVELMYQGEPLRLDRLVQRRDAGHEGEWWVLDYKMTSAPQDQPELMSQLTHYRDAVQQLYPDDTVRAAFLTPQGLMIELEPEQ